MLQMSVTLTEIEKNILDDEIGAGNRTLYDFCSGDNALNRKLENTHKDIDILAAQMWLIGRSYAAQPERRYYGSKIILTGSGDGLDSFYDKMAKSLICEQKDDFEALQEKIKKLREAPRYDKDFEVEKINLTTLKLSIEAVLMFNDMAKKAVFAIDEEDIERAVKVGIESLQNVIQLFNKKINIDNKDFITDLSTAFIEETKKKNCKLNAKFLDLFIKALKEKTDDEIKKNNKKLSSAERETLVIKKINELLEGVWDDNKFEEYKKLMKKKFESKSRNPYSFASKFLHFHAPNSVFIKDTITHNNFSYGKDKDNKDFHFYFSCNEKASELVIKGREIMEYYDDKLGLTYHGDERLYALHCIKEYLLAKKIVTESNFEFNEKLYIPRQLDTYMLIANSHLKKK